MRDRNSFHVTHYIFKTYIIKTHTYFELMSILLLSHTI
jgi:hypothetical protein